MLSINAWFCNEYLIRIEDQDLYKVYLDYRQNRISHTSLHVDIINFLKKLAKIHAIGSKDEWILNTIFSWLTVLRIEFLDNTELNLNQDNCADIKIFNPKRKNSWPHKRTA